MSKSAELALILSLVDEVTDTARKVRKELGDVGREATGAQRLLSGLSNVGFGVVATGAAVAGAGIAVAGTYLKNSIAPASDLNETISKVGVVFGEQADEIMAFAQTSATALGMTQNEALAAAGTYGNLFRSMGMAEETSGDMSTGLVQLAADLASFNNMDPTAVLDKLRAGLTGETEPLKTLGVNINQALLEQKALEMGLWDGESALDAAAKAQASYALIMEQTSLAQGDFARTSDGLANQQRITAATFANMQATIGTAVLPAMTALQSTINELAADPRFQEFLQRVIEALGAFAAKAVEAIPQVIEWFQNAANWLSENEGVIIGVLAALGVAVGAFVYTTVIPAAVAAVTAMAPIIAVMVAIGAAVYLLYEAWTNDWGGIRTTLTQVWEGTLQPIFETIKEWLAVNIPKAIDAVGAAFEWVKKNILDPVAGAFDAISGAIEKVVGWIGGLKEKLGNLSLPEWLTPGSPTPFELGLRGISDAMKDLNSGQLPAFETNLAMGGGAPAVARQGGVGQAPGTTSNSFTITINIAGNATREDVEIGVMRGLRAVGVGV